MRKYLLRSCLLRARLSKLAKRLKPDGMQIAVAVSGALFGGISGGLGALVGMGLAAALVKKV